MKINILYVKNNISRFHKTTNLLANQVKGSPCLNTLPIILGKGQELVMLCEGSNRGDTEFITPYVVNGAFSLELCLKLLVYYETKEWRRGHNLKDLYEKISEDSKNFLRSHVKKRTDSSRLHQEIILTMNNSFNVQFSWDIDKLIEESCNAFDNWRYAFESKEVGWFAGYNEIRNAILERINWLEKDH